MSEWVVGSGDAGGFVRNGKVEENIREWGTTPNGERAVMWTATPSGDGLADGGWNATVNIDHRRRYRYSVWMKKHNSNDGTIYFGCSPNVTNLNNTSNNNPHFWSGDLPEIGKWYLLVGYVHGSSDESTSHEGAIFDIESGRPIQSLTDFKFSPGANTTVHRSYLYDDSNVNDRLYFYSPRLEVVDGTELPLSILINAGVNVHTNPVSTDGNLRISEGKSFFLRRGDQHHNIAYRRDLDNKLIDGPAIFGWSGGALGVSRESGEKVALQWIGNGNVGIGTATPDEKLAVKGKIRAQEIKVEATNWPDYVFEKDYSLPTLEETAQFIADNGHLPEIPKASAIEAHGLSLGEMNKLLLKKIEELTLHLIEQARKNEKQEKMINSLLDNHK